MQRQVSLRVNFIINQALNVLRIGTQFNAPSGFDEENAIANLNEILMSLNLLGSSLPYFYDASFNTVTNQSKYYIGEGDLADLTAKPFGDVAFINLRYEDLVYPVEIINDERALGTLRNDTIKFLPGQARVYGEVGNDGSEYTVIHFLYPPDQPYQIDVRGKPHLDQIDINSTIVDLPATYFSFLKYQLAYLLSDYYAIDWTDSLEMKREQAFRLIEASAENDLALQLSDTLSRDWGWWTRARLGVRT